MRKFILTRFTSKLRFGAVSGCGKFLNLIKFEYFRPISLTFGHMCRSSDGMESWTLSEAMEKRIKAFRMWIQRSILKISWTDHITSNEVLNRRKCQPQILLTIKN